MHWHRRSHWRWGLTGNWKRTAYAIPESCFVIPGICYAVFVPELFYRSGEADFEFKGKCDRRTDQCGVRLCVDRGISFGTGGSSTGYRNGTARRRNHPCNLFSRENGSLLQLGKAKWHGKVIWQTVTNGSSELVTNISTSIVSILYNFQLMEAAGENGVAAYGIIMYVDIIFMTLYLGYSLGSAPIVSFHYGARNHAELKNLCRKSLVIISACGVILLTASQILAGPLVKIFANYDQELLEMTTWGFRIYAIAFMVRGMNVWGSSFFTALNNGAVSAAISFLRTFVFQIVIVLILPKLIGITGVWLSIVLAEFLALFVTIGFLIAKRKNIIMHNYSEPCKLRSANACIQADKQFYMAK